MSTATVTTSPQAHRRKPVAQYDRAGHKVAEYPSVNHAHLATGLSAGNISRAASQNRHRAGDWIWRWVGDGAAPEQIDVPTGRATRCDARPVVQYDGAGDRIAEFASANAAEKATGLQACSIRKCAGGKRAYCTVGGYVWRWTDDPAHLFREYVRTQDVTIRNRIVERYHYVAVSIAKAMCKRMPKWVEVGDVISAAMFGLIDAIEKYDPGRNVKFATFATTRVRGQILDWQRSLDVTGRLSRSRINRREAATSKLRAELGREPYSEELARELKLSGAELQKVESAEPVMVQSLSDTMRGDTSLTERINTLVDPTAPDPADDPNHTAMRDLLLRQFNLPSALMVRMYYVDQLTMKDISEALGLSESRISQLHSEILRALRSRHGENLFELLGEAA